MNSNINSESKNQTLWIAVEGLSSSGRGATSAEQCQVPAALAGVATVDRVVRSVVRAAGGI